MRSFVTVNNSLCRYNGSGTSLWGQERFQILDAGCDLFLCPARTDRSTLQPGPANFRIVSNGPEDARASFLNGDPHLRSDFLGPNIIQNGPGVLNAHHPTKTDHSLGNLK